MKQTMCHYCGRNARRNGAERATWAHTRMSCHDADQRGPADLPAASEGGEPIPKMGPFHLKTLGCEKSGLTMSQTSESDQWGGGFEEICVRSFTGGIGTGLF